FLQPVGLLPASAFGMACYFMYRPPTPLIKRLSVYLVVILASTFFLHLSPGFDNPKIIDGLLLSPDAVPYTKYLGFDSALIGLGILGFGHSRLSEAAAWRSMIKTTMPVLLLTLAIVLVMSLALGYVYWLPKTTPFFFVWAWGNLFFTCIAEEAFFRGFIQKNLMTALSSFKLGAIFALLIAALLFGLAHIAGGIKYVILAGIAGVGYGWAYLRSGRIEASILTHFTLNLLHFLLFTYPVLASALT
ncbi:MAG: CPBP family intramembrane glutamic endopeptidase, partial [Gammaproteobacteria bacterium]